MQRFVAGIKYDNISNDDVNKTLASLSIYEKRMHEYIDSNFGPISSKITVYNLYKNNILKNEIKQSRFIYDFTSYEISDIIDRVSTYSRKKSNLFSLVLNYINYCIDCGYTDKNVLSDFDIKSAYPIGRRFAKVCYMSLDSFWKGIDGLLKLGFDYQSLIIYVMARYGITGEKLYYMRNAKESDINYEENYISVTNDNKTLNIPIDSDFTTFINNSEKECSFSSYYMNNGYLLKTVPKTRNKLEAVTYTFILSKLARLPKTKVLNSPLDAKYIYSINLERGLIKSTTGRLSKSRILDIMLSKRRDGKLNTKDIMDVLLMFEFKMSDGAYTLIKEIYEDITGEKILKKHEVKTSDKEIDNQFVDEVVKYLNTRY